MYDIRKSNIHNWCPRRRKMETQIKTVSEKFQNMTERNVKQQI